MGGEKGKKGGTANLLKFFAARNYEGETVNYETLSFSLSVCEVRLLPIRKTRRSAYVRVASFDVYHIVVRAPRHIRISWGGR